MTFNELKARLENAKTESTKAEFRISQIKESWMKEFGTDKVEEVEAKLEELKSDLEDTRTKYKQEMELAEQALAKIGA